MDDKDLKPELLKSNFISVTDAISQVKDWQARYYGTTISEHRDGYIDGVVDLLNVLRGDMSVDSLIEEEVDWFASDVREDSNERV